MDLGELLSFLDDEDALALGAVPGEDRQPWPQVDADAEDLWALDFAALTSPAAYDLTEDDWPLPPGLAADLEGSLRSATGTSQPGRDWGPNNTGDWDTCAWYQ